METYYMLILNIAGMVWLIKKENISFFVCMRTGQVIETLMASLIVSLINIRRNFHQVIVLNELKSYWQLKYFLKLQKYKYTSSYNRSWDLDVPSSITFPKRVNRTRIRCNKIFLNTHLNERMKGWFSHTIFPITFEETHGHILTNYNCLGATQP